MPGNLSEVSVSASVVKASAPEASVSEDVPSRKADVLLPSAERHMTDEEDAAARSSAKIGGDADVPEDPPRVLDEKAPKKSGGFVSFLNFLKPKTEVSSDFIELHPRSAHHVRRVKPSDPRYIVSLYVDMGGFSEGTVHDASRVWFRCQAFPPPHPIDNNNPLRSTVPCLSR